MRKQVLASVIAFLLVLSVFSVLTWQIKPVQATSLFSDGFETGNFDGWTLQSGTGETIVTSPVHHGTYAAEFIKSTYCYKTVSSRSDGYFRVYINISALPASGDWNTISMLSMYYDDTAVGSGITNAGGTYKWVLYYRDAGVDKNLTSATPTISINDWDSVKVHLIKASGTGEAHLYINGTAILDATGLDNDDIDTNINRASIRSIYVAYSPFVFTADCAVFDSSDIADETTAIDWTAGLPTADNYVVRNDTAGNYLTYASDKVTVLRTDTNPVTAVNYALTNYVPTNGKLVTNGTWSDYNGTVAPTRGNFTWEAWKTKATQISTSTSLVRGINLAYSYAYDFVTLNNLTYIGRNSTGEIGIQSTANYTTVENCTFTGCNGIWAYSTIFISGGSHESVRFNNVSFNWGSTQIDFESVSDSVISNNTCDAGGNGACIGDFGYSDAYHQNVNITSNICTDWGENPYLGMTLGRHGIYTTGTAFSYIYNNTFSNSFAFENSAMLIKSWCTEVFNNTFLGQPYATAAFSAYQEPGAGSQYWLSANGTRFYNNTISDYTAIGGMGVLQGSGSPPAGNITIANNTFNNCYSGIQTNGYSTEYPQNVTISGNIFNGSVYTIRLGYFDGVSDYTDQFKFTNNIIANATYGMFIQAHALNTDVENNTFSSITNVVVDYSTSATYRFNIDLTGYYMLNTSSVGAGYTSPSGDGWQYVSGTNVSETWTPNSGHSRVDFSIDGVNQTTTTSPINITMSADRQTIAYFSGSPPPILLTVTSPTNTTYPYSTVSVELSATGGTVDKIIWNCTFTSGTVVYANQTYTVATSMTLLTGSYIFHAVANNTDGNIDAQTVWFSVYLSGGSSQLIVNVWWSGWW
jgi:hypothetical protein